MIYEIHIRQKLPISKQEAWDFLSDPKNLQKIMPDEMGFEIMSGADRKMFTGQLLQYKVTPLPGFKTNWVTEITHVEKPDYFVDIQLYGPYALWHHKHFIHEIEGGVEIEDLVHYKIPFGILGRIMHPILVKAREAKMVEKFGQY
jgi:ligand-binding SRPBCC domain-containing protein